MRAVAVPSFRATSLFCSWSNLCSTHHVAPGMCILNLREYVIQDWNVSMCMKMYEYVIVRGSIHVASNTSSKIKRRT